jgi:hypothetical protein
LARAAAAARAYACISSAAASAAADDKIIHSPTARTRQCPTSRERVDAVGADRRDCAARAVERGAARRLRDYHPDLIRAGHIGLCGRENSQPRRDYEGEDRIAKLHWITSCSG